MSRPPTSCPVCPSYLCSFAEYFMLSLFICRWYLLSPFTFWRSRSFASPFVCPLYLFFLPAISCQHAFCCVFHSEYSWVTHLSQVTDNMSWTSVSSLTCWSITGHSCHDVNCTVETQLGIEVRLTFCHDHITIHPIRLSGEATLDNLLYISCLFSLLIIAIIYNQHCCSTLLMKNCQTVWIACRTQTAVQKDKFNSIERWQNTWLAH